MTASVHDVFGSMPFEGDNFALSLSTVEGQLWDRLNRPDPSEVPFVEPDPSDYRKQQIEEQIAWGVDL